MTTIKFVGPDHSCYANKVGGILTREYGRTPGTSTGFLLLHNNAWKSLVSKSTWEVNPFKKAATFRKLFLCTLFDQGVHHFLFIFDEHIVKQSKTSMLQNNISIYYILWFFKDIQYCRKLKVWTTWEKLRVKAATFFTGLPLWSTIFFIKNLDELYSLKKKKNINNDLKT